ncbi:energy transducer TonB [Pacificimonas flava]|nr:energy transducer TonB [Pacificimonas flava]
MTGVRVGLFVIAAGLIALLPATTHAAAGQWRLAAEAHVAAHQTMPRSAEIRGDRCAVLVEVEVDRNGLMTDYDVVRPCDSAILMRETDNLFFRLPQFPPPPDRTATTSRLQVVWPPRP